MKKNIYEILDEFKAAKTEMDKRRILVANESPEFIAFLQCAFDPRITFVKFPLPKLTTAPRPKKGEYRLSDLPAGFGRNFGNAVKKVYLFIENHPRRPPTLSPQKSMELITEILESLDPREAELFIAMIHKKVKVPGLTKELIEKTFLHIFEIPAKV